MTTHRSHVEFYMTQASGLNSVLFCVCEHPRKCLAHFHVEHVQQLFVCVDLSAKKVLCLLK